MAGRPQRRARRNGVRDGVRWKWDSGVLYRGLGGRFVARAKGGFYYFDPSNEVWGSRESRSFNNYPMYFAVSDGPGWRLFTGYGCTPSEKLELFSSLEDAGEAAAADWVFRCLVDSAVQWHMEQYPRSYR